MSPPPPPRFSNSSTLTRRFGVSSEIFESSRVDRPRREKSKIVGLGESKAEGRLSPSLDYRRADGRRCGGRRADRNRVFAGRR